MWRFSSSSHCMLVGYCKSLLGVDCTDFPESGTCTWSECHFLAFLIATSNSLNMAEFRKRENYVLNEQNNTEGVNKNASLYSTNYHNITAASAFLSPSPLDLIAQHDCLFWKATAASFTWRHSDWNWGWCCEWCRYTTQSCVENYEFERCSRSSARLSSTNLFSGKRVFQSLMVHWSQSPDGMYISRYRMRHSELLLNWAWPTSSLRKVQQRMRQPVSRNWLRAPTATLN